jgi:tetratricopeptide (TPR) repeat protein
MRTGSVRRNPGAREVLRSYPVKARDEQIAELRRLVAAHPEDPKHLLELGDLLQGQRLLGEAIACYERAADIYIQSGFDLKVVAIWSTIVKLDPTRTALRMHLVRGYLQLDLRDDAIAELRLAIRDYAKKKDQIGLRLAQAELDRLRLPN